MKKILLFALSVLVSVGVNGQGGEQGTQRVREELAARTESFSGPSIEVREQPDAAAAVQMAESAKRPAKITVYGVSLFRDNSQTAGSNARAVQEAFAEMFPEISVELKYENPFFKVVAGKFFDRTDAVALCGKALPHFPKAVVVQEEVTINDKQQITTTIE